MKPHLEKLLKENKVPHALLFVEGEDEALEFAYKLLNITSHPHPDLYIYTPEGKLGQHSLETLRSMREDVYLPPYQAKRKVFILNQAERMPATSANALLKTFEEPLHTSYIFLTTHFPDRLLPTIRSRCQRLNFKKKLEPHTNELLIQLLSPLPDVSTANILDQVHKLVAELEKKGEIPEEEEDQAELTAHAKQVQLKVREGKEALIEGDLVDQLFEAILHWFRDLHVVHLQAKELYHINSKELLERQVQKGYLPSLEPIMEAVDKSKRAITRMNPIKSTLESFFLSLQKFA